MSETESQTAHPEDDASTATTHGSESPMTGDNDAENKEEEAAPLMPMVQEAMQKHKTTFQEMEMNLVCSGLDEQAAGEEAYPNILLEKKLTPISCPRTPPTYTHVRTPTYVHPQMYTYVCTPTYVHPMTSCRRHRRHFEF